MWPGLCVIANGGFACISAACGVTPHAQNTGTSPGRISTASPKSGLRDVANADRGRVAEVDRGTVCPGKREQICVAFTACSGVIGRIDTTIGP